MIPLLAACTSTPSTDGRDPSDPPTTDVGVNGHLARGDGLDVLYLWGSRYEIGYAEGALTCDGIGELFTHYLLEHLVGTYSPYDYATARPLVLGTTTFEPADLEEMQGFYDGATDACTEEQLTVESPMLPGPYRLTLEDLKFANAIADFGCTSFTVWGDASATGDTLHGRNFDWAMDPQDTFLAQHLLKVYDSTDDGGRYASVMVPGLAGCVTCVTDESVSLTMHNVTGLTADSLVRISPRMFSARAALVATEHADDVVAAAEGVLEGRRQLVGNNLHVAMPTARNGVGGVVLEVDGQGTHADGQVTVRRAGEDEQEPRTDATLAANHYAKRRVDLGDPDSNGRVEALAAAIEGGPVGRDDARGLLDAVRNGGNGVTVHAIVVDSAAREVDVYVAPHFDTPATEAEPTTFALDALFDELDARSGR